MQLAAEKRGQVMQAARTLFHERGYKASSLADIAEAAKIPLGNVYYYFKTKEELAQAVIAERNLEVRARHTALEKEPSPLQRLLAFLERIHGEADSRTAHGCPVGNLNQEIHRLGGPLAEDVSSTFKIMLDWAGAQYQALGLKPPAAREEAVALVAAVQGSILLAHSLKEGALLQRAMRRQQQQLKARFQGGKSHA